MITVDEAKKNLESKYSDIYVESAYEYGDKYYLFVAPNKDNRNEPWYLVDKYNGKSRYLNPLENFDLFTEAMDNRQIKTYKDTGGD